MPLTQPGGITEGTTVAEIHCRETVEKEVNGSTVIKSSEPAEENCEMNTMEETVSENMEITVEEKMKSTLQKDVESSKPNYMEVSVDESNPIGREDPDEKKITENVVPGLMKTQNSSPKKQKDNTDVHLQGNDEPLIKEKPGKVRNQGKTASAGRGSNKGKAGSCTAMGLKRMKKEDSQEVVSRSKRAR